MPEPGNTISRFLWRQECTFYDKHLFNCCEEAWGCTLAVPKLHWRESLLNIDCNLSLQKSKQARNASPTNSTIICAGRSHGKHQQLRNKDYWWWLIIGTSTAGIYMTCVSLYHVYFWHGRGWSKTVRPEVRPGIACCSASRSNRTKTNKLPHWCRHWGNTKRNPQFAHQCANP